MTTDKVQLFTDRLKFHKEKLKMFSINGRNIGVEEPPYIIAELSANHNGSIENAKINKRSK